MAVPSVLKKLCYSVIILYLTIEPVRSRPPVILEEERAPIIEANSNFSVTCTGDEPIKWTYFPNEQDPNITIYSNTKTIEFESPNREPRYNSVLQIQNTSYNDVRYYYCHHKAAGYSDEGRSANIYLYVDDPEHLSVLNDDNGNTVHTVQIMQFTTGVLPCRPTSPDITVELFTLDGARIIEEVGIGKIISNDSRTGFKLQVDKDNGFEYLKCVFTKPNRGYITKEIHMYAEVLAFQNGINAPTVQDMNNGYNSVESPVTLKCSVSTVVRPIHMKWTVPPGVYSDRYSVTDPTTSTSEPNLNYITLTIDKARKSDSGEYRCFVEDMYNNTANHSISIKVFAEGDSYMELTEENDVYEILVRAGSPNVTWTVIVDSYPASTTTWVNNRNKPIYNDDRKYVIISQPMMAKTRETLVIKNIEIGDRGNYTLQAINGKQQKNLTLSLQVTDKPSVMLRMDQFHMVNQQTSIKCEVAGYPEPDIYWIYNSCPDEKLCPKKNITGTKDSRKGLLITSHFNITAQQSGNITCQAFNSLGNGSATEPFYVTDIRDGFNTWHDDEDEGYNIVGVKNVRVAVNDSVAMICGASVYSFTNDIHWYRKNGTMVPNDERHTITVSNTPFSYRIRLTIPRASFDDMGAYVCRASRISLNLQEFETKNMTLVVSPPELPKIQSEKLKNEELSIAYSSYKFIIDCIVDGIPKPVVSWYKDDKDFSPHIDGKRIKLESKSQHLVFNSTNLTDEGKYECRATNRIGQAKKFLQLTFNNKGTNPTLMITLICIFITMVVILGSCLYRNRKRNILLKRELKLAGLDNFENGDLNCLNPELGIDDQAELLPYDKRWEFPREKLKLGKQLGSGAFGVVMKAEASGIQDGEDKTVVAVKMVKRNADNTFIRALASELKIMVHLGQHLNVVNLLGACTKNVEKRELLVIVEYCRYGNLHNYLLRHRDNFINQIDDLTGNIDFNVGSEILERSFSVSTNRSESEVARATDMQDYRGNANYSGGTMYTDTTAICMTPTGAQGEDNMVTLSNNSLQPEWRSNYRGDYKGNVKPICTKDLLTWSFQVARGMEYLAARKVLHGDLAARNILLTENNIVKICDFGLAKSIYKNDNYKKSGDGPLPIKWMAVESIRDRVFSTQSDVWAFGIVLWEFFSLARTPYPGMEADERLYYKLVEGYRMDPPQYSTKDIYRMMVDCWEAKPLIRPTFDRLVQRLGGMLEESVKQHYIDLNDPYLVMNTQRIQDGHSDYLAMCSPPDFENLSSPHDYVNDLPYRESMEAPSTAGYLCMKPTNIFSPRDSKGEVFVFDSKKHLKDSDGASTPELLPMLHLNGESECDSPSPNSPSLNSPSMNSPSPNSPSPNNSNPNNSSPNNSRSNDPRSNNQSLNSPDSDPCNEDLNTPNVITAVSNPNYHIPLKISDEGTQIKKSSDNYVNMPQNKSAIKNSDLKQKGSSENVNNYVNSNSRDWDRVAT